MYGTLTMTVAMIMSLSSGTKATKNAEPEGTNKRRTLAYRLASRSCDGLVHVRTREETVEVTDSCFKII